MSAYTIARTHIEAALTQGEESGFTRGDVLHALLVKAVENYKQERGLADTREALDFQLRNLSDDEDYAFMRP
jgi:hypothetical protein